jgi:microsomal prostaglandin-E synthase 2
MSAVTLYQFELCPFCHKVKAGLEVKGIPFEKVEVNPTNKKELPALPEGSPKKVPVIDFGGEDFVFDSTDILNALDDRFPDHPTLNPTDAAARERSDMVEDWVDTAFAQALPTVIYGTWGEAIKAAQVTARTSNFGFFQNLSVRVGGSLIMHQICKRILKRNGRAKGEGHAWVNEETDRFEAWLGDAAYIGGDTCSLGDVAMHGALTCVADFPIFEQLMGRPALKAWYGRVAELRAA